LRFYTPPPTLRYAHSSDRDRVLGGDRVGDGDPGDHVGDGDPDVGGGAD
jgi:hypothetical protein